MEKSKRRATSNRGMEENTLAILESFCSLDSSHVHDDRLAFLEAVRFASIVPENGTPPTNKMMKAIFEIMRETKSLELIVASYQLLCELEKHFPRVCLSDGDDKQGNPDKRTELVVYEEAWSPIAIGSDVALSDKHAAKKRSKEPIDAAGFQLLLESLSKVANEPESSDTKLELLAKMYLFQYLVYILEADFLPRNHHFRENSNWICVRDSLLNKLLGSRQITYKDLVYDSIFVLCDLFLGNASVNRDTGLTAKSASMVMYNNSDSALGLCLPEAEKCTCKAVKKLIILMTELDLSRKKADMQSLTTRADGARVPVVELIIDELSYDKDIITPFLQPSTRKRKSEGSQDDATNIGFFKCFVNSTSTKGIVKKVGAEAVQVLLAHALQACMSISKEQLLEEFFDSKGIGSSPLASICKNIISAFTRLKETDEYCLLVRKHYLQQQLCCLQGHRRFQILLELSFCT
ncbi:negative regulator of systemic acquired resistance SNI1 isoform X4 [Beta vulgaris subsp. vulgaris]|uniref:negative regulator of systemic acquired resistance SNI1 isoform X4 n=1 Tax=Beta vulgaris subsp. vulgaris TaxID=3555 RepID=UPI00203722F9|nr:negative regulator of systemic acquired resistance SNI1 isoform X4 [Beta vulgaris subsp. vulgaris]